MATYSAIYDARFSTTSLQKQTAVAIATAAQNVLNESSATTNHTKRVLWANDGLMNASDMSQRMMWGVLGNATIQANPSTATDNDVQFVVNGLVNTFANMY
jgi:hypothetical protein